jgi:nucleoid-associated protein YgaU
VLALHVPRVAPSFVRRLVGAALGTSLALSPMVASASTSSAAPPAGIEAPVLHKLPDDPSATPTLPAPEVPAVPAPSAAPLTATVTARPGDHLWSIASRMLAQRLGRPPTDAEIAPFWERLVAANRDRLASGDPDLIFPGEEFVVPS